MQGLTEPQLSETSTAGDLFHWVCCDENKALCGTDFTEDAWVDGGDECVVCRDLVDQDCRLCDD